MREAILISAVSDEFGSYREILRDELDISGISVKIQEFFPATGTETLAKLDINIQECTSVIHIVGNMSGAMAQKPSVDYIKKRYPDFGSRLIPVAQFLEAKELLPYTQWEAWLALYHKKHLFIAIPDDSATRDAKYVDDPIQKVRQSNHLARLKEWERFAEIKFKSAQDLAYKFLKTPRRKVAILPAISKQKRDYPVVGRQRIIDDFASSLQNELKKENGFRKFAFTFLPGIGKTTLALELIQNDSIVKHFPDGVLWAHLGDDPDIKYQLSEWARLLQLSEDRINSCIDLISLRKLIRETIGDRKILIILDDVWSTRNHKGDHNDFPLGLPGCVYVITTRKRDLAYEFVPSPKDCIFELPKLTQEEGLELLATLVPSITQQYKQELMEMTLHVGGLPIALVIIGKMLKRSLATGIESYTILGIFSDLSNVLAEPVPDGDYDRETEIFDKIIEESFKHLSEEEIEALKALSTLRADPSWFPIKLARLVANVSDNVLIELNAAGLIEKVQDDDENTPTDDEICFKMHRMVATCLRKKVGKEKYRELNQIACEFYRKELEELESSLQETGATLYQKMYRYENTNWQIYQDNWLYYFGKADNDQKQNATFAFLSTWFNGFWWWNCFTKADYDFCDELIKNWDYKLRLANSKDVTGGQLNKYRNQKLIHSLGLLSNFKSIYPVESENRNSNSWEDVATFLNDLRKNMQLDQELLNLTNLHARHVRALTDIFLAEAKRFCSENKNISEAEKYYTEALTIFIEEKEDWNIAWCLYHLGDMLWSSGSFVKAQQRAKEALGYASDSQDFEVLALIYRLLGDIELGGSNIKEVIDHYHMAIESAYRFQVMPVEPDFYTVSFYTKLAHQILQSLKTYYELQPQQAEKIALALRKIWMDCDVKLVPTISLNKILLRELSISELMKQIFPSDLPPEHLRNEMKSYQSLVKEHLEKLKLNRSREHKINALTL